MSACLEPGIALCAGNIAASTVYDTGKVPVLEECPLCMKTQTKPNVRTVKPENHEEKDQSTIVQLKQATFWGAPGTGQSDCLSLSRVREQPLPASQGPFYKRD